jgi:YebC/PmpR family DNA-binding regulatory protein
MSGHNKWSKVKHKKAATDAKKSKAFSKHAALIALESKKAGGDVQSPGLAAAIERAKKDSMPKENIDRAVVKGKGGEAGGVEEVVFECFGPGGTAMIVTALTDNNNRTAPEIRHILSRFGYQLGAPGSSLWAFTKTENEYTPNNPVDLSDEDGEKLASLIEALDEHDDIQDVFTTADSKE